MIPSEPEAQADFGWTAEDVEFLVGSGVIESDDGAGPRRGALTELTRTIATQYVDVLAGLATAAFAGRADEVRAQFLSAVDALHRLAVASDDLELASVLADAPAAMPSGSTRARERESVHTELSGWVFRFADLLPEPDRGRMRAIVEFDHGESPFVQELLRVDGIGEKRMQRLYNAGLFTVTAVCGASAAEIVSVTGIPLRVAERVLATAKHYEHERPRRLASHLIQYATQTREALVSVSRTDPRRAAIVAAAREAVTQLMSVLDALDASEGDST